jgi:hypothetical protein
MASSTNTKSPEKLQAPRKRGERRRGARVERRHGTKEPGWFYSGVELSKVLDINFRLIESGDG